MTPLARSKRLAAGVLAAALIAGCGPAATPSPSPSPLLAITPPPTEAPTAASTESPSPSAATGQVYVVKKGDTLIRIAFRHGVTLAALLAANPEVTDPTKLRIGQKLVIPTP